MRTDKKNTKITVTVILLLLSSLFIISSIGDLTVTDPNDEFVSKISGAYFMIGSSVNITSITYNTTYAIFNGIGFNVTSGSTIFIELVHADEDVLNPADDNDLLLSFNVTNTPGDTWFNLSGFEPSSIYIIRINNVFSSSELANGTGVISFSDIPNLNDVYSIYRDSTPPVITINYAGNLSDSGGPYYIPPAESGIHTENGYYTNDSRQSEDWIYINLTVTDAYGVSHVWLQWLNETTWTNYTYEFTNQTGAYFDINTTNNFTVAEGYNYSFNIAANDTLGNNNVVWWNKTGLGDAYTRRNIQLNCSPTDISYKPYYIQNISDAYVAADASSFDKLHHDQGTCSAALGDDTGFFSNISLTDTIQHTFCTGNFGLWFDETVCASPDSLSNIYYHVWWNSTAVTENSTFYYGYKKSRGYVAGVPTGGWSSHDSEDNMRSSIPIATYGTPPYNTVKRYKLQTVLQNGISETYTDNDIYEYLLRFQKGGGGGYVGIISNRSYNSFILFNVPSNATLNSSYADSDSDGLSDWNELYSTYTNPFLNDTDNDSINDYHEYLSGSDPNNYTDTTTYTNTPPSFGTPTPTNNSNNQPTSLTWSITITDIDSDLFNWTIEVSNGDTQSGNDEGNGVKQLSFSGGSLNTQYTVWVNATDGNDNSGNWTNHTYYFTIEQGTSAVISNPSPNNNSIDVSVSLSSISVTIEDPDGVNFDWYITTTPDVGSDSGLGESNGSKTCSVGGLSYDATYTWYVNVWDTVYWTNRSYDFTVESSPGPGPPPNSAPVITSPYPDDVSTLQVTTPYCHIYVIDADGDLMTINFYNSTDGISWTQQQMNSSVSTGTTVYWNYTQATGYNTLYYWRVTADDAVINISETYSFTTYPNEPVISSYSPVDGSVDIIRNTTLSVTFFDYQGTDVDINWRSNSSGSWVDLGYNNSVNNGTYIQYFENATEFNTEYWWCVNITDGTVWTNATYSFTTLVNTAPVISDPIPRSGKVRVSIYIVNVSVMITDANSDFNYTIETSPDVGSISENDVVDGVKTCTVSGLNYSIVYTWYINVSDGEDWVNTSYTFTTKSSTDFDLEGFKLNLPEWALGPFKVYVGDFVWMFIFVGVIAITWGSSKHISSVLMVILLLFAAYGTQRVFVDNSEISLLFSIVAAASVAAIMLGLFLRKRNG